MKRLFAVKTTAVYIVVADDHEHAKKVAIDSIGDFMDWEPNHFEAKVTHEVDDVKKLPIDWDADSLPYGNKNNETCGDILDALRTRSVRVQEVE